MVGQPAHRLSGRRRATQRRLARRRSRRRRRLYPALVASVVALFLLSSLVGAASTPGNENLKAKWADWLRDHHAALLVTPLESWYYDHNAPKKGGQPVALNPLPGRPAAAPDPSASPSSTLRTSSKGVPSTAATATTAVTPTTAASPTTAVTPTAAVSPTTADIPTTADTPTTSADASATTAATGMGSPASTVAGPPHLSPPSPVPLLVSPALPQEGQWQAVGPLVDGVPGMYEAQFRADDVYTSQITSAVWIDPTLLHLSLRPGATEPGGSWSEPPDLVGTDALAAVAAFNGGFRFQDAHGGFYLDGHQAVPLRTGAASVVIYSDGRVDVGTWGSEVTMAPDVSAVLQNLTLIVDHGHQAANATYNDASIWGQTLGSTTVVARSGLGVTASGGLVYVAGPALTAKSLAESLQRSGAVRGMALDLNPEWVTFNFFSHDAAGYVTGTKLYPQMQRAANRYLGPTQESRDFFAVST